MSGLRNQLIKWKFSFCVSHLRVIRNRGVVLSVLKGLLLPVFPSLRPLITDEGHSHCAVGASRKLKIRNFCLFVLWDGLTMQSRISFKLKILLPQASKCWGHNTPTLLEAIFKFIRCWFSEVGPLRILRARGGQEGGVSIMPLVVWSEEDKAWANKLAVFLWCLSFP